MIGPEEETVSRWIDVSAIGPEGTAFDIVFDEKAIAVLVARLDLLALDNVRAEGKVWPMDDGVVADFHLTGHVEQACVVTLESVRTDVDERVSLHYTPATSERAEPSVIDIDEDDDPPELLVDDRVDIGAAMAEHLALALDPWPRKPDAELPAALSEEDDARENPFAVLSQLKTEMKDKGSA
jgi:uncharacterized metal-binding protein YceD (DUF177 family)